MLEFEEASGEFCSLKGLWCDVLHVVLQGVKVWLAVSSSCVRLRAGKDGLEMVLDLLDCGLGAATMYDEVCPVGAWLGLVLEEGYG